MDLQTAFYIVGIVFMSVMLLIILVILSAVLVIRAKINAIHKHLEEKFGTALSLIENGSKALGKVKEAIGQK